MSDYKPIIGITMGDAAGIGPEIIIKSLINATIYEACRPFVLGDLDIMRKAAKTTRTNLELKSVGEPEECEFRYGVVEVLDFNDIDIERWRAGTVDAMNGDAAVRYTKAAGLLALEGRIDGMTSAPLNKAAMNSAGHNYEGHTQILGELCESERYAMIMIMGRIRLMLLSRHMALREALDMVTYENVLGMLKLAHDTLIGLGFEEPLIAVAGINPHAGESGLFGDEEIKIITPAMKAAEEEGIRVAGPYPADTLFVKARKGIYDMVLTMYHDQGLMAAKLIGFGKVVTLLAGLPIIRTSVGHGTAFDIAWKNMAEHENMIIAVKTAAEFALRKKGLWD